MPAPWWWPFYWLLFAAAAVAARDVSTATGVDPQRDPDVSPANGATTQANLFPKDAPATWNQDEEKSGALESELRLLEQADPTDPYDPLEELDDTDQQRDRPTDDEDEEGSDVTVTTLVPTATTEEDTRVDEPTDRGPAEPTKENGVTVTMVMEQSAPSATLSPDVRSPDVQQMNAAGAEESSSTTKAAGAKDDDVQESEEEEEEEEEDELEAIKRQMKEEDDLIPVPSATNQQDDEIADELDDLDISDDIEIEEDAKSVEKEENGGAEGASQQEVTSSPAISAIGHGSQSPEELFSRSTRRVQETPAAGQFPAKVNEDVLELMVRLTEKPRSWAKISNLLGKLDYESASQLKSALQIQALKDNQATEESAKHNHNHNMKHIMTAAKLASSSPSDHDYMNSASGKNHHSHHQSSISPGTYDHSPNAKPKIPGKHNNIFNNNNKLGLKQLTTSNGRHGVTMHHPPPPNTIHVQWEKNRRPPAAKDTIPVHTNTRLQYLAQKAAGAQTASSWYDPSHIDNHFGTGKGAGGAVIPMNSGLKPLVSSHHNPSGIKDIPGVHKPRPLGYPYRGPISTLAVDVPGKAMLHNKKYPGGEKNNQAFIAVSVYKPKDSYRQVDLSPKMNRLPVRYPTPLRPKGPDNSNFAMEKPVTVVGSPAIDVVPSHLGHKGFKNRKGKGRNKGAKAKQKGKNGMKMGKNHHARKLKYSNKMATDEIEAQLLALSKMERKLKQHLMQKEKLRQRIRMKHDAHHHNVRSAREVASFM